MGSVVAFPEPAWSRRVVIYRVQPYWLDRGAPGAARVREYRTERDARVAARALAARYWRAEVWVVTGYAGSDCWEEPVLLAAYGDAPTAALAIAESARPWA